jgi:hypothetical protein
MPNDWQAKSNKIEQNCRKTAYIDTALGAKKRPLAVT